MSLVIGLIYNSKNEVLYLNYEGKKELVHGEVEFGESPQEAIIEIGEDDAGYTGEWTFIGEFNGLHCFKGFTDEALEGSEIAYGFCPPLDSGLGGFLFRDNNPVEREESFYEGRGDDVVLHRGHKMEPGRILLNLKEKASGENCTQSEYDLVKGLEASNKIIRIRTMPIDS